MHGLFTVLASSLFSTVVGQLSLPNPPVIPPAASNGTIPSSGTPNPQWSTLLGNLIYFYEAQRSGRLPSDNRVGWRNDSALQDGSDVNIDLTGGYYDAGDYIKSTFPLSFTITSICWGATDFGKGYDDSNQTAYLDSMLRWGLDWLIKAHPLDNTLYVQVANGSVDNNYWGGDEDIPTPRPSFQINDTSPGTDVAAGVSAVFSACSNLYANRGFGGVYQSPAALTDTTYSEILLNHAQSLFTFAVNASGGQALYQTSVPSVTESYASSSYQDELTLAALFLAWATNSTTLYQQAENYYSSFGLSGQDGVFNWDSKTPGLAVLFAQIAQSGSSLDSNPSRWQEEAERYFDRIVNNGGPAVETKGGLLYYPGDSDEASLNPALNAAMLLTRYAPMASSSGKTASYMNYAQKQLDYALGKNPMSVPYVVGSNPNSPSNPHSAMASGGDDITNIDNSPEVEAYVLYGAVVGGPDEKDTFHDMRSDWVQTEIALDYNAPMLTLAAMHVLNDTNDPYFTALQAGAYVRPQGAPCDAAIKDGCGSNRLSKGAIIAIAVCISVVGVVLVSLAAYYFLVVKKKRS
ncbi:glycoside hydrolase family 9 protein [Guyanagaster necrorhizus]|uniref:Endoglucanase n=1 Tax=Guyanagaster necrorhizus TaxID=856835 RepID=A0A9P7W0Y0_9AGAR|nr:glycoside hydrolase family 9 protein [Guyanagaster necrorhizus MCA 3950]KAG7449351.1 glycoside hydrolase family 9 protein [Guyanagaster necrorhizus MCA 3950]